MQAVVVPAGLIEEELVSVLRFGKLGIVELAAGDELRVVLAMDDERGRDVSLRIEIRGKGGKCGKLEGRKIIGLR
jgi:hypothetical protein